jgi:uncharacterized protein DUF6321
MAMGAEGNLLRVKRFSSVEGFAMPNEEKRDVKKRAVKKAASKSMPSKRKDPKGGLTAAGREFYKKTEGASLKPGVKGKADTPEKMRRKGSFLTRHFTHPRGPMVKDGEPTRLALSAHAWGEAVPKTEAAAKKLAAKGRKLLERYRAAKEKTV